MFKYALHFTVGREDKVHCPVWEADLYIRGSYPVLNPNLQSTPIISYPQPILFAIYSYCVPLRDRNGRTPRGRI